MVANRRQASGILSCARRDSEFERRHSKRRLCSDHVSNGMACPPNKADSYGDDRHALNDADIPFHQTKMIYRRIFGKRDSQDAFDTGELEPSELMAGNEGPAVFDVKKEGFPRMRFDFVEHGGASYVSMGTGIQATNVSRTQPDPDLQPRSSGHQSSTRRLFRQLIRLMPATHLDEEM